MYETLFRQKLNFIKESGNYRYFLEVNKSARHFPQFYFTDDQGKKRGAINWCSNDYLSQSTQEEVISKLSFVTHSSGAGSGGTRNISGTTNHHKELEKKLAQWHRKDAALLFNGAYAANVTTLQTIGRAIPELIFISDERNHASLIEGMRATNNTKLIFQHNDVAHLESILNSIPVTTPRMVVLESVYSIKGSVAPLQKIAALAKKYNALSYVDEVHAVGLYGKTGAGMLEATGLQDAFDIINGTLSKSIGVYGGYITASATIIDFVRSFGSGFIFTTSLPPAICAAAIKSISLVEEDNELRHRFHENVQLLRECLSLNAIPFQSNPSHITSIHIGDASRCRQVANDLLLKHGIYLQPINSPTVSRGEECLRIIITSKHQLKHINHLAFALKKILYPQTLSTVTSDYWTEYIK